MTEENAVEETDNLAPETFSFFDTFEGQGYPKDKVTIFTNEKVAYDLNRTLEKISRLAEGEERDKLVDEAGALHQKLEASEYTFSITGVPDDMITDLRDVADKAFEDRKKKIKGADGRNVSILPDSEQLNYVRYFNALVMSVHIEQVVDSRGRVNTAPSADEVAHLLDKAPTSQKEKLQRAVNDLRVSASDFEASISSDFLAKS